MASAELERVTRDAVETALADFPIGLAEGWDHGSLAARVRDALAQPLVQYEVHKERASNASVKAKISIIARHSKKMRSHLDDLQYDARSVLKNPSNFGNFLGYLINSDFIDNDIDLFLGGIQRDLQIFEAYLNNSAKMIKIQKAKWNVTQIKNLRITCGEALIDVFEDSFGRKITLNNWCKNGGDARHKKPTPFMAFYQLIMFIIFNESVTPNLADILKEARAARIKQ
jgi:hypothetical protein